MPFPRVTVCSVSITSLRAVCSFPLSSVGQANATAIVAPGGFVDGLTALLNSSLVSTRAKYEGVWTGEFTGYFTVRGTPLDSIKGTFVSAAGGSTFMSISVRATEDTAITDFIVALRQWCADYQTQFGGDSLASASAHYTVGVTGLGALFYDVLSGSEKDMIKMDSIVLPLALTVLGFFLARYCCVAALFHGFASILVLGNPRIHAVAGIIFCIGVSPTCTHPHPPFLSAPINPAAFA